MTAPRVRLGDLLVEAQIITPEQLQEVLDAQRRGDGRKIGALMVEAGWVTETQVTQLLSQQLSIPWVSLYHIDFSRQLLNLVPREIAERYCLVPIFVRRVRGLGEALYVAMDDPTDEVAQQEVARFSGLHVRAMIAPPSDIRSAIRVYYGDKTRSSSLSEAVAEEERDLARERTPTVEVEVEVGESTLPPDFSASQPPEPAAQASSEQQAEAGPSEQTADDAASLDGPAVEPVPPPVTALSPEAQQPKEPAASGDSPGEPPPPPSQSAFAAAAARLVEESRTRSLTPSPESTRIAPRHADMPRPRQGPPTRVVTLTLLDGTQVALPARPKNAPSQAPSATDSDLTARDLVAALRAVSHGADATEILGENVRWEPLVAALLSLLLKKHLIADWEFVDEYKKV